MMKISCRKLIIVTAALTAALAGTLVYAAYDSSADVSSRFSSGAVNIETECFQEKNGERTEADELTVLDISSSVSYIPQITNKAEDAYIRVSLEAESAGKNVDIMQSLRGISSKWKIAGGYMYYTEKLEHNESVDLCSGFEIPPDWDYRSVNRLDVRVVADAVQAANMTPDFSSETPWGDIAVVSSEVKDEYTVRENVPVADKGAVKIVCSSSGLTVSREALFEDEFMMPGGSRTETLKIRNDTDKKTKVFFKAEYTESRLLDSMTINITGRKNVSAGEAEAQIIYSGPMAGETADKWFKKERTIAELQPGEERLLEVTAEFPSAADNGYQLQEGMHIWYFAAEKADAVQAPRTGDTWTMQAAAMLMIVCMASGGAAVIAIRRKKSIS